MGAAVRITHSTMENLANVTQMPMGKAPVALPLKGGVEIVMPIANVLAVKTSQVCKNINCIIVKVYRDYRLPISIYHFS